MSKVGPISQIRNRRVLIVEDNALIAMGIEAALTEMGCAAIIAREGAKALEAIEVEVIDCAVVDVSMVLREDLPLAEVLKGRGIPCLFSTALDSNSVPARYKPEPILYKPYSTEQLIEAVETALRSSTATLHFRSDGA